MHACSFIAWCVSGTHASTCSCLHTHPLWGMEDRTARGQRQGQRHECMHACSTLEIRHQLGTRATRGRRRRGRPRQRALHAGRRQQRVQRRQQRPCFVSGWAQWDRPPLDQSTPSLCKAGGAARTAHARVAAEASTAAASCLPPAQTLTPRFWELEVVGIGASDVVGTVEKRPYFYVLGPTYMLVSDFFFSRFRLSPETPREHWEGLFPVLLHHGGGTWYDSRGILQV